MGVKKPKSNMLFLTAAVVSKSVFKEAHINYLCRRVFDPLTAVLSQRFKLVSVVYVQFSKCHQRSGITTLLRCSCERQCLLEVSVICRNTADCSEQYFRQKRLCWDSCATSYIMGKSDETVVFLFWVDKCRVYRWCDQHAGTVGRVLQG